MIAHGQGHGIRAAVVCFAALALAGCGANGTSQVYSPPGNPAPSVSGTVYAPNGQFAAAERWWQWANALRLMPRAYASQGLMQHINSEESVSLSSVNPTAAAHGCLPASASLCVDPIPGGEGRTDPQTGTYRISNSTLTDVNDTTSDRLLILVGGGDLLTRAFVFSCTTQPVVSCTANVDAWSEAVVRLVFDYLARTTAQLSDFSNEDLGKIDYAARILAGNVSGTSVAEMNDNVYNWLAASPTMQNCLKQPDQCD